MISMSVPEAFPLSQRFLYAATVARPLLDKRVAHLAARLQTRVKAKASGRPGPRAITGDYRRSITRERVVSPGFTGWIIGTNAPQARRLEFGFVGKDSIGRVYNQPPYPHFGPAIDEMREEFHGSIGGFVNGLVRVIVA